MNLELSAPAKLNLFLHVVGCRTDGYHELQSVFVLIDLCDTIRFTPNQSGQIIRSGDIIGAPEKDLCVRAAKLLQQKPTLLLVWKLMSPNESPLERDWAVALPTQPQHLWPLITFGI